MVQVAMEEKKLEYLIYLGCTIPARLPSYEISARRILKELGVELVEMPDFNCCGLPIDPVNHEMMVLMAARILCLAEEANLDILTLCPGCSGALHKVNKMLKDDSKLRAKVNEQLKEMGMNYKGTTEVKHLVRMLHEDIGLEKIKVAVSRPLIDLRVAEHNGCHLLRPKQYEEFDDPENPKVLKSLIEVTGAECLDYVGETDCCGSTVMGVNENVPLQLVRNKLSNLKAVGIQALITVCPSCHVMFDLNQHRVERIFKEEFGIPVLHYTQLLGLAMGIGPEELAIQDLRVKASSIIETLSQ